MHISLQARGVVFENSRVTVPSNSDSIGVTLTIIPHLAYVDFPTTMHITSLGILNFSIVVAKAKEFGGIIMKSKVFFVTKLLEGKFFWIYN